MIDWITDNIEIECYAWVCGWHVNREHLFISTKYVTYYYAYHPIFGTMETSNWRAVKKTILIHTQQTLF